MTNYNTTPTVRVKRSRRKQKKKNFFSEFLAGNQKFLFFRLKPKVEPPKQRGRSRRRVKKKKHVKLKIFLSSIGLALLYSHFALDKLGKTLPPWSLKTKRSKKRWEILMFILD